jgi:hypothetical protein
MSLDPVIERDGAGDVDVLSKWMVFPAVVELPVTVWDPAWFPLTTEPVMKDAIFEPE